MNRGRIQLALALLASFAAFPGCFDEPKPPCAFRCSSSGTCPSSYTCASDDWCKAEGVLDSYACEPPLPDASPDASPADASLVDAAPPDASPDATPLDAMPPDANTE